MIDYTKGSAERRELHAGRAEKLGEVNLQKIKIKKKSRSN